MKIRVECYSGYKPNQRPVKFWIDDNALFVESIVDQWHGVDAMYFRVHADDGKTYILRYTEGTDVWKLEQSPD